MKKPNILMILTDQQSCWTLGAYGGTLVQTPHIDRIAAEGARLDNYFTNSAVCTPSRGCLLTGRYPHGHGAFLNDVPLGADEVTLAHILRDHQYETGYIGKWHLDGTEANLRATLRISGNTAEHVGIRFPDHPPRIGPCIPPERARGFDDCRYMVETGHGKKVIEQADGSFTISNQQIGDEQTYTTDWLFAKADAFVSRKRQKPFFLVLSIPDPHTPFSVRAPYDRMYAPEDMPVPETFYDSKPAWLETDAARHWTLLPEGMTEENLKKNMAQYCGEVKCIDDNVGLFLDRLKQLDLLDETILIFTTDHGEYMGEHGIMYKNQLFETAYHIPFLIRWPGQIRPGTVVDSFISTVDIQQTLLGLAGVSPCGREQGRDASPLLREKAIPWEDEVFIYGSMKNRIGVFTPEYELAYVKENVDNLLFDRVQDPLQRQNVFNDPEHKPAREALKARIIAHARQWGSPELAWLETGAKT
ncbi:MAG: sulfatase-like hydrolase/transferase [Eubacteriales bacterium]|nr:sulfatase-like hydrolase/transferase [Eubacteriales bacterium]MDD4019397.1 sulfatase-like hydrolase/transferase [Kiritimatiellia bacterium]NLV85554.1 sulfatase-like hydrolase/transferase [Spirochaetales bacterium]